MPSGKQIAEDNVKIFEEWQRSRTDADFRAMVSRGVLSRTQVANQCGFAKSVLDQNPRVKHSLRCLEDELRSRNVLPSSKTRKAIELQSSRPLYQGEENTAVEPALVVELKREVSRLTDENALLRQSLNEASWLREMMILTGRVPR